MKNQIKQLKTVLITQNGLKPYAGSEIVTLELATFFQQNNIDTTVFTWYYSDPIKSEFKKRGINVVTDESDPSLKKDFDLIWINHQVLPHKIIQKLEKTSQTIFIFFHMSYLDNLYLEQPYVHELEQKISTISLFVSKEVLELNLKKYGDIFQKPTIFPNWSPDEFLNSVPTVQENKKMLIVSNHPPVEIEEAKCILEKRDINIEYIGYAKTKYNLITPELLKQYSCVISIGKTVQYCLTLNIPIYVYDHFGGCGFLNGENYEKAKSHNFSGRGFNKKTSTEIAEELTSKFDEARLFQTNNLTKFKDEFSLRNNFEKIFLSLPKQHKDIKLDNKYINYVISAESLAKEKVVAENKNFVLEDELHKLNSVLTSLKRENEILNDTINSMENSRIIKLDKKIRNLISFKKKA